MEIVFKSAAGGGKIVSKKKENRKSFFSSKPETSRNHVTAADPRNMINFCETGFLCRSFVGIEIFNQRKGKGGENEKVRRRKERGGEFLT